MISPTTYSSDTQMKAFASQYTAIILIILTFVLGAFSTQTKPSEARAQLRSAEYRQRILLSSTELSSATDPAGKLRRGGLQHVKELISHHDLFAEFIVTEKDSEYLLQNELTTHLLNEGLSPDEFTVFSRVGDSPSITFNLFR